MKVACVLVSDFEVAVELARRPELAGQPVVVGGLPHERKRVRSRSPEAAAYGVAKGMPLRQARGLCPEAVFLPVEEELYRAAFDRLMKVLEGFSPTIETRTEDWGLSTPHSAPSTPHSAPSTQHSAPSTQHSAPSTQHSSAHSPQSSVLVYLDAEGLERLFGSDRELGRRIAAAVQEGTGLRPRVGIGSGKFVARMAALQAAPGTALVVNEGKERAFLAPLPVGLLPCSEEMRRRMDLLGLRTLGQLAGLPDGALGEQFGPEGVEVHRLARGIEAALLVPREAPRLLEKVVEIDPPTEQAGLLFSTASALIERLSIRMRSEYLACREVVLQLGFSGGQSVRLATTLHEPTDEAGELMRAVGRLLGRIAPLPNPSPTRREGLPDLPLPPCGGEGRGERDRISSLRLSLSGFGSRGEEQLGLFRSRAGNLQKVRRALQRAEEQFGEEAIRPLAEVEGEKVAAVPLRVMVDEIGWPAVLFLAGRQEPVREVCNRWRVREEWWRREVYRDYFRLITESGQLCVVYRDLTPQPPSWFMERIYA